MLFVVGDDKVLGVLALEDAVRPESAEAVDGLHHRGRRVVMITGDARQVAAAVAADLGVDKVLAEVLAEDKARPWPASSAGACGWPWSATGSTTPCPGPGRCRDRGRYRCGLESAGIVLAANDPRRGPRGAEVSQASCPKMVQNLGWATGYNLLAVPVAAGVLAWAGVTLAPAVGAVLMRASTIVVALNTQLLQRLNLRQGRGASHDRPGRDRHHHGRAGAGGPQPRHAP